MWKIVEVMKDSYVIYESKKKCPDYPDSFPSVPEGWKGYGSGGQFPHYIVFNPEFIKIKELTANERLDFEVGRLYVDPADAVLSVVPSSVHGCWKAIRRQLILILRKDAELLYK